MKVGDVLINESVLIEIGSTGRNAGKTTMATKLINKYAGHYPIYGLKIITISGDRGKCQRGVKGCGICTSISSGYELVKERRTKGNKDTTQMLNAGCREVYLLKSFNNCLEEAFETFLEQVPPHSLIVCESNSLRKVIAPDIFLMMHNDQKKVKPSAQAVLDLVDYHLREAIIPKVVDTIIHKLDLVNVSKGEG